MNTKLTTTLLLLLTLNCGTVQHKEVTVQNEDLVYCDEDTTEDCYYGENW